MSAGRWWSEWLTIFLRNCSMGGSLPGRIFQRIIPPLANLYISSQRFASHLRSPWPMLIGSCRPQYMESSDDLDQKLYCHYFKISFLLGAFSPNGCILECFSGLLHSDRNTQHIKRILVYIIAKLNYWQKSLEMYRIVFVPDKITLYRDNEWGNEAVFYLSPFLLI